MSAFICEKCGRIDNSANSNNYWAAMGNKYAQQRGDAVRPHYTDEYFDTHTCCAICCKGLQFNDGSGENYFIGDRFDCVTDYTYKDKGIENCKGCSNYEEIKERDSSGSTDN